MKKLSILFLAFAVCFALCACGGGKTVSHAPAEPTAAPQNAEFAVHAFVPKSWGVPSIWAWSSAEGTDVYDMWPGAAMTATADGWYTLSLPSWVDNLLVNGADGSVQTADIPVEAKELWIVVGSDLSYELSYDGPIEVVQSVTVSACAPVAWENIHCWAWSDSGDVFDTWPGDAMVQNGNWYTIELPDWTSYLIINGNDGLVQTADLSIESGKDVWVVVCGDGSATVRYQEPTGDEVKELSHQWVEATCNNTRYCAICKETEGSFGDHTWAADGCLTVCSTCGIVETAHTHDLGAGNNSITGTCTVCKKHVENFYSYDKLYAWTEYEIASNGNRVNPVTFIKARSGKNCVAINWFENGNLRAFRANQLKNGLGCNAFYVGGNVYYFTSYSTDNSGAVVDALMYAANNFVSYYQAIWSSTNYTTISLCGPDGILDEKGDAWAAYDVYGNTVAIVHKASGSWDIPDDPNQTWVIACDWMK